MIKIGYFIPMGRITAQSSNYRLYATDGKYTVMSETLSIDRAEKFKAFIEFDTNVVQSVADFRKLLIKNLLTPSNFPGGYTPEIQSGSWGIEYDTP